MNLIDTLESRQFFSVVVFNIDSAKSSIRVEAEVNIDNVGRFKLQPQFEGSNITRLQGTVRTDISSTGVRLLGGSRIDLVTKRNSFQPGNSFADLGVKGRLTRLGITLYRVEAALRNLTIDLTSTSRLPVSSNNINLNRVTGRISSGKFDYSGSFNSGGSQDLTGEIGTFEGGRAAFTRVGSALSASSARSFSIPVNFTIEDDFNNYKVKVKLTGTIVANRA